MCNLRCHRGPVPTPVAEADPQRKLLWATTVPPSLPGAGARVPTSETQTSGILERPEVEFLLLPARPLFSFLPCAVVTGTQQSPPWSLSERTRGEQEGAAGPGSLGCEPQPPTAQVSDPGRAHAAPPRPGAGPVMLGSRQMRSLLFVPVP